jgi:enamine deaminase RidA (YjgF/YER057c/UK114 family)
VKVTVLLRDMGDFGKLNAIYAKYFPPPTVAVNTHDHFGGAKVTQTQSMNEILPAIIVDPQHPCYTVTP